MERAVPLRTRRRTMHCRLQPTTLSLTLLRLSLLLLPPICEAVLEAQWWSSVAQLSTSNLLAGSSSTRPTCVDLRGLSPGQARICELFKDHMPAIGQGAKSAIDECEHQFREHRWNCSTHPSAGIIGPVHKLGTREAAFTYAIMSAGVTHEVGRRCRLGMLKSCGCSEAPRPAGISSDWVWGGCGDNVDYGYRFARDFIDVREKEEGGSGGMKRSAEGKGRALMNRWNNEAGRKILKRNTRPKCKCHGVSGSCTVKTCWMQLPTLRQIGNILHNKYQAARRIQINARGNMQFDQDENTDGSGHLAKRSNKDMAKLLKRKSRAATELVFLDDSPDYCRADRGQGTVGTQGRVCVKESSGGANSCDVLCCGRGYDSYTEERLTKCECKFQWCCQVVCQTCRNITQVHICK